MVGRKVKSGHNFMQTLYRLEPRAKAQNRQMQTENETGKVLVSRVPHLHAHLVVDAWTRVGGGPCAKRVSPL